ncbi:aminotransferase class I/II-fold pyridoxal phosphate-dependent enzyme [Micromonospora sp. NPDC005172]|uniref:aminotransferase class I/II-fold pyridoxal phosphate-dependent enzyme n=1 Tax=Micromonospora sp. NPDC005172 TaxID=3156867 RepID=UPI0033A5C03D
MSFEPFALVEWQSRYEPSAEYTLADSSCQPVRLREFVTWADADRLLDGRQHYPSVRGTPALRELIADWQGCRPEEVLVTVGAAEANTLIMDALVGPDDHVVLMEPGYRQVWGLARNTGAKIDTCALDEERGWRIDLAALESLVRPDTRAIVVTNPNNPTGSVLSAPERAALVAVAARNGAWLVVDEVHRGTELDLDTVTPTLWGGYDRVICVGSLSKAFALPGLRVGWIVAPAEFLTRVWRRHEYLTVSTGMLAMQVAELALADPTRDRLLDRNRRLMRAGRSLLVDWVEAHQELVSIVPPTATALGFVRYRAPVTSLALATALRVRGGVLVGAGAHFGWEGHFRVIHSLDPGYVSAALDRVATVLAEGVEGVLPKDVGPG